MYRAFSTGCLAFLKWALPEAFQSVRGQSDAFGAQSGGAVMMTAIKRNHHRDRFAFPGDSWAWFGRHAYRPSTLYFIIQLSPGFYERGRAPRVTGT